MKNAKKLFATLLAVLMMCSLLPMTAFAAGTGSIIIDSGGEVGIHMNTKTFKLYQIFEATQIVGGGIQYDWIQDSTTGDPMADLRFYKFFFDGAENQVNPGTPRVVVPANGNTIDAVVRYINGLTTAVQVNRLSNNLLAYIKAKSIAPQTSTATSSSQTQIVYDNLPFGYYLIEDAPTTTDTSGVVASVMLTTTDPTAIHLKATKPTIEKYVFAVNDVKTNGEIGTNGATVSVGDKVTYRISIQIPDVSTYLDGYFFHFRDSQPESLNAITDLKVQVNDNGTVTEVSQLSTGTRANYALLPAEYSNFVDLVNTNSQFANLVLATYYGPDHTEDPDDLLDDIDEGEYAAVFKNDGIIFDLYETDVYPAGKELEIFYSATVNEKILGKSVATTSGTQLYSDKNTAYLHYTTNPAYPVKNEEGEITLGEDTDEAVVATHLMEISKFAADSAGNATSAPLTGVEYMVYKESTTNGVYESDPVQFVKSGNDTVGYRYDVATPDQIANATTLGLEIVTELVGNSGEVTGKVGYVEIYGMGDGDYKLVETVSPAGYRLPAEPFFFTVGSTTGPNGYLTDLSFAATTANDLEKMDSAANDLGGNRLRGRVTNIPGNALPSTGGIGTTLFTVGGVLLMAAAAAWLMISKKRSNG